jgi:hypothetical protein
MEDIAFYNVWSATKRKNTNGLIILLLEFVAGEYTILPGVAG